MRLAASGNDRPQPDETLDQYRPLDFVARPPADNSLAEIQGALSC